MRHRQPGHRHAVSCAMRYYYVINPVVTDILRSALRIVLDCAFTAVEGLRLKPLDTCSKLS